MQLCYFKHNKFVSFGIVPKSTINFCELTLLLNGSLEYAINKKTVVLKSGDVLYAPKNATRVRKAFENSNYVSFNFYPAPDDEPLSLPLHIVDGVTNEIRLLLSACDEIHAQMTDDSERLTLILRCILKQLAVNLNTKNFSPLTLKIKKFISDNLGKEITLEDIGNETFFSPAHCASVFRRETGKSIIDYAIDEKLKAAKKLIIEGLPLKCVAETVGFDDYSYFSRLFKKRVSLTPLQYKKFSQS